MATPDSDLIAAAQAGDLAAARAAIAAGAAVRYTEEVRRQLRQTHRFPAATVAVAHAAERGDLEMMRLLLDHGANGGAQDDVYGPLTSAAVGGQLGAVRLLLDRGVPAGVHGANALLGAATSGHLPIAELLLAHGANAGARDGCALIIAAREGHLPMVHMLLARGAATAARPSPYYAESSVDRAFQEAAKLTRFPVMAALMDYHGALGDRQATHGIPEKTMAAALGSVVKAVRLDVMQFFAGRVLERRDAEWAPMVLDQAADRGALKDGVLEDEVRAGLLEEARRLLAHGVAPLHALEHAAGHGDLEMMRLLLPAAPGRAGAALQRAASRGRAEAVELLLAHGADVAWDESAAMRGAAFSGHAAIVARLLALGASASAKESDGLKWAAHCGHLEVVILLLAHGASATAEDSRCLQYAAEYGHLEVVKLLLTYGASASGNRYGALHSVRHLEVAALLLSTLPLPDVLLWLSWRDEYHPFMSNPWLDREKRARILSLMPGDPPLAPLRDLCIRAAVERRAPLTRLPEHLREEMAHVGPPAAVAAAVRARLAEHARAARRVIPLRDMCTKAAAARAEAPRVAHRAGEAPSSPQPEDLMWEDVEAAPRPRRRVLALRDRRIRAGPTAPTAAWSR